MKILQKSHLADSQFSGLKLELDPYFAGQMHRTYYGWGDDGQSIYRLETAPDNIAHDILEQMPVMWPAVPAARADATEHMSALEFVQAFPRACGPARQVWTSEAQA